jgi:hypothetical protein
VIHFSPGANLIGSQLPTKWESLLELRNSSFDNWSFDDRRASCHALMASLRPSQLTTHASSCGNETGTFHSPSEDAHGCIKSVIAYLANLRSISTGLHSLSYASTTMSLERIDSVDPPEAYDYIICGYDNMHVVSLNRAKTNPRIEAVRQGA